MQKTTTELLEKHRVDIELISRQRRKWLFASSVVIVAIVGVIAGWDVVDGLHSAPVWWVVVSAMMLVSANWWYWTMSVMRKFIDHQQIEFALIHELVVDIREIRKDVTDIKELSNQDIDKSK